MAKRSTKTKRKMKLKRREKRNVTPVAETEEKQSVESSEAA